MVISRFRALGRVDSLNQFLRYMGTMQICIARMLRESGIFFAVRSSILSIHRHLGWFRDLAPVFTGHRLCSRIVCTRCCRRRSRRLDSGKLCISEAMKPWLIISTQIVNILVQALLQYAFWTLGVWFFLICTAARSPNYDRFAVRWALL
jgi:hypothetical protein